MSKLLLRWLPEERVRALSERSRALVMTKCACPPSALPALSPHARPAVEYAQELGTHVWREELFRDAGGDILYMHVSVESLLTTT